MKTKTVICIIMLLAIAVNGCSNTPPNLTSAPKPDLSTPVPVKAAQPSATLELILTPSPIPTETATTLTLSEISKQNVRNLDQVGHIGKGIAQQIFYSADGKYLIAIAPAGVYVYDAQTAGEAYYIETGNRTSDVAISPDGKMIAAGRQSGKSSITSIWRLADGKKIQEFKDYASALAFSVDGQVLAVSGVDDGHLWRIDDSTLQAEFKVQRAANEMIRSANHLVFTKEILAAGFDDGTVRTWRLSDGTQVNNVKIHNTRISAMTPAAHNTVFASLAIMDAALQLYQSDTGQPFASISLGSNVVVGLAVSPDTETIATGGGSTVNLWRASDGSQVKSWETPSKWINGMEFSPDGTLLVTTHSDGTVHLWQVQDSHLLHTFERAINSNPTFAFSPAIAFSPDGSALAIASQDNVYIWHIADGMPLPAPQGHTRISAIAVSPDGATIASASTDNVIRLWRIGNGALLRTMEGHTGVIGGVSFSPDGKTLISGSYDKSVRLWNTGDGMLLNTRDMEKEAGIAVFSPDGQTIATTSGVSVYLWHTIDGEPLATIDTSYGTPLAVVAFSPDGSAIATGVGGGVQLRPPTGESNILKTFRMQGGPMQIVFSANGTRIAATGGTGGSATVWDVNSGREIDSGGDSVGVAFSPNGEIIAWSSSRYLNMHSADNGKSLRPSIYAGVTHYDSYGKLLFTPNGDLLIMGSEDGLIRLWGVPK